MPGGCPVKPVGGRWSAFANVVHTTPEECVRVATVVLAAEEQLPLAGVTQPVSGARRRSRGSQAVPSAPCDACARNVGGDAYGRECCGRRSRRERRQRSLYRRRLLAYAAAWCGEDACDREMPPRVACCRFWLAGSTRICLSPLSACLRRLLMPTRLASRRQQMAVCRCVSTLLQVPIRDRFVECYRKFRRGKYAARWRF